MHGRCRAAPAREGDRGDRESGARESDVIVARTQVTNNYYTCVYDAFDADRTSPALERRRASPSPSPRQRRELKSIYLSNYLLYSLLKSTCTPLINCAV